jgi:FixJ family two-component response regulator
MTERSSESIVAVVDDDRSVLRSLEYRLESADYAVRLFTSAQELLDSGGVTEIQCMVSDIDMPGMDGDELQRVVRATRPELPVILITGYPDAVRHLAGLDGNPRCFTKPFDGPELLAAISEAIRILRR